MGMLLPMSGEWTAEMVWALPDDGNRYEVVDGVLLVSPAPTARHQQAIVVLWRTLYSFLRPHRLAWAAVAPLDVQFGPRRLVQPDVLVTPLIDGRTPQGLGPLTELLLAVEVLSSSTRRADRGDKRRVYQEEGVPEYWIVDLEARCVERWRPGDEHGEVCRDRLEWHAGSHAPSLTVDLSAYFAEVFDEVPG
jgi:Uma2 family endonuclease